MRLLQLQEQIGSGHLFIVYIEDYGEIPFKLPSVTRSKQYISSIILSETESDIRMVYEYIFRECVIDPDIAFNQDMPAGIPESIGKLILYLSGTLEDTVKYTGELFNTFRSQVSDPVMFMKRTICSMFSGYTFRSLGELDYQDLVELFINAEKIMLDAGLLQEPYEFNSTKETKKSLNIATGPAGMPGPSSVQKQNNYGIQDNTPRTASGNVDINALIAEGREMQKFDMGIPAKAAHNLHDNPSYKAKKETTLNKLNRGKSR